MTREELRQISIEFKAKKNERIEATLNEFIKYNGKISDKDLAEELRKKGIKTSRSTIDRDLTNNLSDYFIELNKTKYGFESLTEEQENIILSVRQKRLENKVEGNKKGGINSSINNEAIKDEKGHFKGSKKRV